MMLVNKTALLASAAATALMIASSGSAYAFDEVNWVWDKYVDETVEIDIDIEAEFLPSGMVEVEKLQLFFGDVTATATAYDIDNQSVGDGGALVGGTFNLDETFNATAAWTDPDPQGTENSINPVNAPGGPFTANTPNTNGLVVGLTDTNGDGTGTWGNANEDGDQIDFLIRVEGEIELTPEIIEITGLDAIDLPKVHNAATAVANNQDIYTTSALFLHDAQIATGDINQLEGPDGNPNGLAFLFAADLLTQVDGELDGVNAHTDLAILAILGAATGFLEAANITATAHAYDILNASVDNSATAVGNNASFEIATTMKAVYEEVVTPGGVDTQTQTHTQAPELVSGDETGNVDFGWSNANGNFAGSTEDDLVLDVLTLNTPDGGPNSVDIDYLTQDNSYVDTQTQSYRAETDVVVKTDAVMIADLTQLLIGDVRATATANDILIDGYTGFGAAGFGNLAPAGWNVATDGVYVQTALVKNVATAVGNNLTIKVDGCSVCAE